MKPTIPFTNTVSPQSCQRTTKLIIPTNPPSAVKLNKKSPSIYFLFVILSKSSSLRFLSLTLNHILPYDLSDALYKYEYYEDPECRCSNFYNILKDHKFKSCLELFVKLRGCFSWLPVWWVIYWFIWGECVVKLNWHYFWLYFWCWVTF